MHDQNGVGGNLRKQIAASSDGINFYDAGFRRALAKDLHGAEADSWSDGKIRDKITDEALDFIVEKALEYKLGARGLRSLCEAILTDAMYELPSSDDKILEIDVDYAKETFNRNLLKRLEIAS